MTLADGTVGDLSVSSGIRGVSFAVTSPARSNKNTVRFCNIVMGNENLRYLIAMNFIQLCRGGAMPIDTVLAFQLPLVISWTGASALLHATTTWYPSNSAAATNKPIV